MSKATKRLFNLVGNFVEWEGLNPGTHISIKLANREYMFAKVVDNGIELWDTCLLKEKNIRKISRIIWNKPYKMLDNGDILFLAKKKYIPTRDY